ncbi:MAG: VOC family protein [Pseudobacteriovorax sp.]|nr:VOC family protein [Pseudobacteriovorax sp.]
MEIDHYFIATSNPDSLAESLIQAGFHEGRNNTHPGQGTANRCFFFQQTYLEILFPTNEKVKNPEVDTLLHLGQRIASKACPFGLCLRNKPNDSMTRPPFPFDVYDPQYFEGDKTIAIGKATPAEPLWFFLNFVKRPEEPYCKLHNNGVQKLSAIEFHGPWVDQSSKSAQIISKISNISLSRSEINTCTLVFDSGIQGRQLDLRQEFGLLMKY